MIGNERDAALAFLGDLPVIGEGCSRIAYMADNVVYKVELSDEEPYNRNEYIRAIRWANQLPPGVAIPAVHLWNIMGESVLAMEYVSGDPTGECMDTLFDRPCTDNDSCIPSDMQLKLDLISYDLRSWGNVIRCDDILYLIDLGTP